MQKHWSKLIPYILVAPAFILMLLVVGYPILNSIYMSFLDYTLFKPKDIKFVGLANYLKVLSDPIFRESLLNTVLWVVFGVFFQFLFGLILALLLNRKFKGRGIVRSVILIPWVTPGVLIGLMWRWMYDGNYGVINDILSKLHIIDNFIPWLSSSDTSMASVIITIIWQGIPFFAIMLLAGLQAIPQELYESAYVDGAGSWHTFWHITLPMLKPTILISTLLRIIWVANSVDVIYIMTGGGPGYSTHTLSVYTYIKAQKALDFGYSATLAIYLTVMLASVAFVYFKNLNLKEVR
ncbi:sugar ABC transporter permease [Tepidanaerobacter sp. GT38]|uniref:carbohydrate ABC transporter permease n=1 Tax=Tepidanaerobacter sp. GT38 TaxID=2722793 RepID=UPI001F2B9506|nr:sugar ABC transporter permease [Tepidanaerobacter sp. GT38]MCG1012320.1 sugar ABC transporter permease [Tepidanaerobacter sp. GT38]